MQAGLVVLLQRKSLAWLSLRAKRPVALNGRNPQVTGRLLRVRRPITAVGRTLAMTQPRRIRLLNYYYAIRKNDPDHLSI